MKKKPVKRRWPYFFGQRSHGLVSGYMPELIKPESELQSGESGFQDILRWADDGGKTLDPENRTAKSDLDDTDKGGTKDESQENKHVSGNNASILPSS